MQVMIIDDSVVMRRILGSALRGANLPVDEVVEAGNGTEAITLLEKLAAVGQSPGLVLCDVHMPRLDGVGFLRRRSELGLTRSPVLMITSDANDPLVAEAVAAGASGYLAKPFCMDQLHDYVRNVAGPL